MKTKIKLIGLVFASAAFTFSSCNEKNDTTPTGYQQINLVADIAGYSGARIDTNLANAWGIAIGPTGAFWISANHTAKSTVYDRTGAQLLPDARYLPNR